MEYQGKVIVPITMEQKLLSLILEELVKINKTLEAVEESIPLNDRGERKL